MITYLHAHRSFSTVTAACCTSELPQFLTCLFVCISIDATAASESYGLARYMNHSRENANLKGQVVVDRFQLLHACFLAKRDIEVGEPLLIDYGERRREVVNAPGNAWLKR
jgi:hypothetical protein